MRDIWEFLKCTDRPIVLYGMGNGADKIIKYLNTIGKSFDGVFASNDFVRGHFFREKPVMTFSQAKEIFPDMIVLVSFGTQLPDVMDRIKKLDAEVYAPDVPVVGDNLFDRSFYEKHIDEIEQVRNMLADEQSRLVFEETLRYKLDGKIKHLTLCESKKSEMLDLLEIGDSENYLDLGAYNGDTVIEFSHIAQKWKKITALEPDSRNFRKLLDNTKNFRNISCLNYAVSDFEKEIAFASKGGRNSKISENGKRIKAVSIDSLNEDFTLIKFDVEGEELEAVCGGENTIKKNKPKMLVSAYHRSEDIFLLPLKIKAINPEYKVYLRHLPYIPAWDTNYIFK